MSMLVITPKGESKAEVMQDHSPEYTVLSLLYETNGPVDFEEVVDALHTTEEKASMICRRMISQDLIREA